MRKALASSFAAVACCMQGVAQSAAANPLELIVRAERSFAGAQNEDGILLLWDALELLRQQAMQPTSASGTAAASKLLQDNDPLHGERLAAFTAFARTQVDLAIVYRGKKWFSAAAVQLDVADRFDATAATRERAQLAAAKPKSADTALPETPTLLQRASAVRTDGPWQERGDTLECGAHEANTGWFEWIVDATHADCELSVEFRSSDPKAAHDCALLVGVDSHVPFYQVVAAYYAEDACYDLVIIEHKDGGAKSLGNHDVKLLPTASGFHRLTFRVQGTNLLARLDDAPALEVKVGDAPRGRFGLTVGLKNQASVPITLRDLRIGPWPPLTEEEVRTNANAATQQRVAKAIDTANWMIKTKPEVATLRLRAARRDLLTLPASVLRTSLTKTVEDLLNKSDLLYPRWKRMTQEGARSLVAVADRYAAAGQDRAALRLVAIAADVDPEGCAARLAAAKQAVEARGTERKR
ncbi:MAG TPA: hypothetical protein VF384_07350 [Planctomycetota bacterium]